MTDEETFAKLKEALLAYDEEAVASEATRIVETGADVVEALDVLSITIRAIGNGFETGEVFLPELMLAADAMAAGTALLTPALPKGAITSRGTIVFGTVKGDIHDLGKMIVGSLLSAVGFNVIDIGIDVPPAKFAEAAERNEADIIAITACMNTSVPGQRDVIEYLDALGIREKYKVMIGGASCTSAFADEIGADGYGDDASQAAKLATDMMARK